MDEKINKMGIYTMEYYQKEGHLGNNVDGPGGHYAK